MSSDNLSFRFRQTFVDTMKNLPDVFVNNELGRVVYERTYSRVKSDDTNEVWWETIKRVVEGCYSLQKDYITSTGQEWNDNQAHGSAEEMYDLMYNMKFLPPGRGLWCMGSDIIHKKGLGLSLFNCSFVSTEKILDDPCRPFCVGMDMLMLGVGLGADTKGAGKVKLYEPVITPNQMGLTYVTIEDTREGWVRSLEHLLLSYFIKDSPVVVFDYSSIRKKGVKLKTFGGVASGPEPLIEMHNEIDKVLKRETANNFLSSTGITDIFNLIGSCVVSGNIRRSAELILGEEGDEHFLDLKNYEKNPHRMSYGWASNNSVLPSIGRDYSDIQNRICNNGEPGIIWLENMRKYSRMCDPPDWRDRRVLGTNPCGEISLDSYEVCNLNECFPARHTSLKDFKRTLKYSFLFTKTVTLAPIHIAETQNIVKVNRRIGNSMSGIAQFIAKFGIEELRIWCKQAYLEIQRWDAIYSRWMKVPRSIKTTTVKPSGTVSLLASATPGVHYPHSRYYIRRVRMTTGSPQLEKLKSKGYYIEPCAFKPEHTAIVEFPVDVGNCRTLDDITMWEQLELAAFMQHYYADNQVSCTVTFQKEEGKHIAAALNTYQYRLKGISFLPRSDDVYPQMPYEKISKEQYEKMCHNITERSRGHDTAPLGGQKRKRDEMSESLNFCDGDTCTLNL